MDDNLKKEAKRIALLCGMDADYVLHNLILWQKDKQRS